jgi:hypothetical protein
MTERQRWLARIVADNDQDRAECSAWWQNSTDEELLALWLALQQPCNDPVLEVICRFAQLAFAEQAVRELA